MIARRLLQNSLAHELRKLMLPHTTLLDNAQSLFSAITMHCKVTSTFNCPADLAGVEIQNVIGTVDGIVQNLTET
jgi:hypothetical protein